MHHNFEFLADTKEVAIEMLAKTHRLDPMPEEDFLYLVEAVRALDMSMPPPLGPDEADSVISDGWRWLVRVKYRLTEYGWQRKPFDGDGHRARHREMSVDKTMCAYGLVREMWR